MIAGALSWWGPVVLYMALIFHFSTRPRPDSLSDSPDVLLHGAAYFVLTTLVLRALERGLARPPSSRSTALAPVLSTLYGAFDEWRQTLVPERVGSLADVGYDGLGSVAAAVFWWTLWRLRSSR